LTVDVCTLDETNMLQVLPPYQYAFHHLWWSASDVISADHGHKTLVSLQCIAHNPK